MATEIQLSAGQIALVDDEDVPFLQQWKWSASKCQRDKFVAIRSVWVDGHSRSIYMAREILGLAHGDGLEADHVNHDTLDNRRSNLRVLTPGANKRWQPSRDGSSSVFVGVTWDKTRSRWRAQIQLEGKVINLGRYTTEQEAADARDAFVIANATGHVLNHASATRGR